MNKKKIAIIAVIAVAVIGLCIGGYVYSQGDHAGPEIRVVSSYAANYGEKIGLFDLVQAVSDQSEYTIKITKGGQVSQDGRSTVFDKAGNETVEITAVDEHGQKTVKNASVTVTDAKPPMLSASDIMISLCDRVDYKTGVTAEDEMDGNLTGQIQVDTSLVDESKAGIYPIVYSVSDKSGNVATLRTALIIQSPQAEMITLSQQSVSLEGNGHYQLAATVEPRAWAGKLEWSTSNDKVAVVANGLITWVGTGSCTVTVKAGDVTANCSVLCGAVTVSNIVLDLGTIELDYDQTETLVATVVPSNWEGEILWTSSDETIATVEEGVVTWVGEGECIITATADGVIATCEVTCNQPEVQEIDIIEPEITLKESSFIPHPTYALGLDITPYDWPGELIWETSDPSVATVEDGVVTFVGTGECTITVTAGSLKDTCTVVCEARSSIGDWLSGNNGNNNSNNAGNNNGSNNED